MLKYGIMHRELDELIALQEDAVAKTRENLTGAEERLAHFKAGREALQAATDPASVPTILSAKNPLGLKLGDLSRAGA